MPVVRMRVVVSLAAILVALAFTGFRLLPATQSSGDRAFLELYTFHAAEANLAVGPYSRFGWNHPGPTYFYALAPFYVLGGHHEYSLGTAALLINLATLVALIVVVLRVGDRYLDWSLMGTLAIFLLRPGPAPPVGALLASPWNPHIVILPLGLLIVLCAALAIGRTSVLPAIAFVATFVIHTHVGLALAALALVAAAAVMWMRASSPPDVAVSRPAVRRSIAVLALLWILPLWDQVVGSQNLSEIARFLTSGDRPRPPVSSAIAGVVYGMSAAVDPTERLALGAEVISVDSIGPFSAIWLVAQVAGLVVVWRWATRQKRSFHAALCVLGLLATMVAAVSALGIRGMMRDYLCFWMSAIGMVNLVALGGAGLGWMAGILGRRGTSLLPVAPSAAVAFLSVVVLFGCNSLAQDYRRTVAGEGRFHARRRAVEQLSQNVSEHMRDRGFESALIRFSPPARVVTAGVVLQLLKKGKQVSVADPWVHVFTEAMRSPDRPDVVFRFVGAKLDAGLMEQAQHVLVARYGGVSVYEERR